LGCTTPRSILLCESKRRTIGKHAHHASAKPIRAGFILLNGET
jgi:hypothetical protein